MDTKMDVWSKLVERYDWQTDAEYDAHVERMKDADRQRLAELVKLASFLSDLDVPAPSVYSHYEHDWVARWWVDGVDNVRELRRAIGTPGGGSWSKVSDNGSVGVELTWGNVRLVVMAYGQTCEAVVVGTQQVEQSVEVCPDCDADLAGETCSVGCGFVVRLPARSTRTVEQDVIEWRCPDLNGEVA